MLTVLLIKILAAVAFGLGVTEMFARSTKKALEKQTKSLKRAKK